MALLHVEVVVGTEDVARNNACEVAAVLLVVSLQQENIEASNSLNYYLSFNSYFVLHVDHSLGVAVAKV